MNSPICICLNDIQINCYKILATDIIGSILLYCVTILHGLTLYYVVRYIGYSGYVRANGRQESVCI